MTPGPKRIDEMENLPQNVTCWRVKWIHKEKERLHFSLLWWSKVRQLRVSASPLVLQTRGPWFWNEMQILLSSKRTTSNRWETLRFFFCLYLVRRLWRCLQFRSGFILRMQQLKGACVCGGSWSTDATPLLVKSYQVFGWTFLDNPLKRQLSSLFLVHIFSIRLCPSIQLSITMCCYCTLWTTSSLPCDCAYMNWTRLKDTQLVFTLCK